MAGHVEFQDGLHGSRVIGQQSILTPPVAAAGDLQGHGTRVAGVIAGRTSGVAPFAKIFSVRVIRADGGGEDDDAIQGLRWIIQDAPGRAGVHRSSMSTVFCLFYIS